MSASPNVLTTGVTTHGPLPHRREVRDMKANQPLVWELFLEGMKSFQQQAADEDTSFFAIAGIHGLPYQPWNGVAGRKDFDPDKETGGYCTHSSILFATWHRPYLALFEQELYRHVRQVAAAKGGAYAAAAEEFRLPYWDWALPAKTRDEILPPSLYENIGDKKNPLASFVSVEPIPGTKTKLGLENDHETVRDPDQQGNSNNTGVADSLLNTQPQRREGVRKLLLNKKGISFNDFSTNKVIRGQSVGQYASLESTHDEIHVLVGQGGHMNLPATAAFDPIFWLHHCNIDRLMAIWQDLHPRLPHDPKTARNYIESAPIVTSNFIFEADKGDTQDKETPLKPFWKTDEDFWTSDDAETTEKLGYLYTETQGRSGPDPKAYHDSLEAAVESLFGMTHQQKSRLLAVAQRPAAGEQHAAIPYLNQRVLASDARPDNNPGHNAAAGAGSQAHPGGGGGAVAATAAEGALTPPPLSSQPGSNSTYDDWTVVIRSVKHILGGPYQVVVFLGNFAGEPGSWVTETNQVGSVAFMGHEDSTQCAKCREDTRHGLVVSGTVPLTAALVDDVYAGRLASLEPADVAPYLRNHLHWRVLRVGDTEVPRDQLADLVVAVASAKVTLDHRGLPDYSADYTLHRDVTNGRPGGLDDGQEL